MIKNQEEIINIFQEAIEKEYSKILKVNILDKEIRIAISRANTPSIKGIEIKNGTLIIKFIDDLNINENYETIKFLKGDDNKITAIVIPNIESLKTKKRLFKLNRIVIEEINSFPENSVPEILIKHRQKRMGHVVSEIAKEIPKYEYLETV